MTDRTSIIAVSRSSVTRPPRMASAPQLRRCGYWCL